MVKRIWKNRLEFYPAFALFIWYAVGCVLTSLTVRDRPGIVTLGLITLPSVALYITAVVRTYRGLPPAGRPV
jgi:hypothetical protein